MILKLINILGIYYVLRYCYPKTSPSLFDSFISVAHFSYPGRQKFIIVSLVVMIECLQKISLMKGGFAFSFVLNISVIRVFQINIYFLDSLK